MFGRVFQALHCLVWIIAPGLASDDASAQFAVARAALRQQLTSIRTLAIDYAETIHRDQRVAEPLEDEPGLQQSFEVRLDGARTRLQISWVNESGTPRGLLVFAYDGRATQMAHHQPAANSLRMHTLTRKPGMGVLGLATPLSGIGLRMGRLDTMHTLSMILDNAPSIQARFERHNGANLLVATVPNVEVWPEAPCRVECGLDPSVDWLPKWIRCVPTDQLEPQTAKSARFAETFECEQFTRIRDAFTGEPRWFPMLCRRLIAGSTYEMRVTRVTINEALPGELFTIAPQRGTRVVDETQLRAGQPLSYIEGGPAAEEELLKERVAEALQMPLPATEVEAVVTSGSWIWRATFWCSATVLALCIVRWTMHRVR